MAKFTLYTRSFHSQSNFGIGGLFYAGDHRGFSNSETGTISRIHTTTAFDIEKGGRPINNTGSDWSHQPIMGWSQEYKQDNVQPKGTATYEGTPHVLNAIQHSTVTIHHGGQNFAMPGLDSSNRKYRDRIEDKYKYKMTTKWYWKELKKYGMKTNKAAIK